MTRHMCKHRGTTLWCSVLKFINTKANAPIALTRQIFLLVCIFQASHLVSKILIPRFIRKAKVAYVQPQETILPI